MISTSDLRPQRFAWAPGSYLCHCNLCQQPFAGDKRATLCAPCAYNDAELEPLRTKVAELSDALNRGCDNEAAWETQTDQLKDQIDTLRAENERLKGYLAGSPSAHVEACFQLAEELGYGGSSKPPIECVREELDVLRFALTNAGKQLAVGRRYLPSHGSLGEDGIDAYEGAQQLVKEALEP